MSSPSPAPARMDLDGNPVAPLTICMIGAGGFIGSHLCEKLMAETAHVVLAVDVYCDKIRHLVDPAPPHLAGRISFHRLNIKNDSRLEGLIKMADLVGDLPSYLRRRRRCL
jgi:UDP-apiose/xylose synthase